MCPGHSPGCDGLDGRGDMCVSVFVCVFVFACICICVYMFVYVCVYICICMCVYLYLGVYLCLSVYLCAPVFVYMHIYLYLCVSIYMCLCLYMYLCVCISVCVAWGGASTGHCAQWRGPDNEAPSPSACRLGLRRQGPRVPVPCLYSVPHWGWTQSVLRKCVFSLLVPH